MSRRALVWMSGLEPNWLRDGTEVGRALCARLKTCRSEVRTSSPGYGVRQRHTRTCYQNLRNRTEDRPIARLPPKTSHRKNVQKNRFRGRRFGCTTRACYWHGGVRPCEVCLHAETVPRMAPHHESKPHPAGRAHGDTCRDIGCNWIGPAGQKCVELRHAKCLRARFWVRKTPTQNYTAGLAAPVGRGHKPHGDKARPPKEG